VLGLVLLMTVRTVAAATTMLWTARMSGNTSWLRQHRQPLVTVSMHAAGPPSRTLMQEGRCRPRPTCAWLMLGVLGARSLHRPSHRPWLLCRCRVHSQMCARLRVHSWCGALAHPLLCWHSGSRGRLQLLQLSLGRHNLHQPPASRADSGALLCTGLQLWTPMPPLLPILHCCQLTRHQMQVAAQQSIALQPHLPAKGRPVW
jgi:hypothetical protein